MNFVHLCSLSIAIIGPGEEPEISSTDQSAFSLDSWYEATPFTPDPSRALAAQRFTLDLPLSRIPVRSVLEPQSFVVGIELPRPSMPSGEDAGRFQPNIDAPERVTPPVKPRYFPAVWTLD